MKQPQKKGVKQARKNRRKSPRAGRPVKSRSGNGSGAVKKIAEADFPTRWGRFRIHGFATRGGETAVALVMGDLAQGGQPAPLVRVHSQCLTGDVFGSLRCDCRAQLEIAREAIATAGRGVLIYEQQEGRGIGLGPKLRAYELQDQGLDTVEANEKLGFEADLRGYELPGAMLKSLGVRAVRLLSNNPEKVRALEAAGIRVVERLPCQPEAHVHAEKYLKTKREKMGHLISK